MLELTAELEQHGQEIFGALPEDASDEELVAAERRLLQESEERLDELVTVAPEEISDDLETFVTAFRARAAGEEADASDGAILAWEEENCPA